MARNPDKQYWTNDLPDKHSALVELDKFCDDQGGISRADATRMILIAWAKGRQGISDSVWAGQQPAQTNGQASQPQQPLQGTVPQQFERPRRTVNSNAAAAELDI